MGHRGDAPFAWWHGRPVSAREYLHHVQQLAAALPPASHVVNLCEDRYHFLVAFAAALVRGQITLLPPNRARRVVEEVAADYPGSYCLVDSVQEELALPQQSVAFGAADTAAVAPMPHIAPQQVAAILFTSGSTGKASANTKRWGELVQGALLNAAAFELERHLPLTIVATVPPQHMYGLETTVMLPLVSGCMVHAGRPFFPDDLRAALGEVPERRLLISTPLHLRACLEAGLSWPHLAGIVSATAPLTAEMAQRVEAVFGCELREIYGSTETGAIATRRTALGGGWHLHPTLQLLSLGEGVAEVSGGHLASAVSLNDVIDLNANGSFTLAGRHSDMINIAGKRASLGDLTHKLLEIPGVEDGAFLRPEDENSARAKLVALVVAPRLTEGEVMAALKERLDPVYLPRPLYRVERLPRTETGKLPREALLALLAEVRGR